MILPSYSLTATERVLPILALDWTTGLAQSGVDVVRSGIATFVGSNGLIQSATANTQRLDWSIGTSGLLVEEPRTNALLNSLIDGTSLATQSVTVTAVARTLSFYGTGTIVLSGVHSATVVGSGAYPTRTILTFTPSAGVLTLTVTGTVQFAQLEIGAFATSYIPTEATAVTRNADVATMTGTNFSDWFNPTEGTFAVWFTPDSTIATNTRVFNVSTAGGGGATGRVSDVYSTGSSWVSYNGSTNVTCGSAIVTSTQQKITSAYKSGSYAANLNGGTGGTAASVTLNTPDRIWLGTIGGTSSFLNGRIQKLLYWPQRLTNAEVQAFSK